MTKIKCNCGGIFKEKTVESEGFNVKVLACNKCKEITLTPKQFKKMLKLRRAAEEKKTRESFKEFLKKSKELKRRKTDVNKRFEDVTKEIQRKVKEKGITRKDIEAAIKWGRNTKMVEDELKNMEESVITVAELKKRLPAHIRHNTMKSVLLDLEKDNKIAVGLKGITWIHNLNPKLRKAIMEDIGFGLHKK